MTETESTKKKKDEPGKKKESENKSEPDKEEAAMSFVDHLEELRKRLFVIVGAVTFLSLIAYGFSDYLLALVTVPLPESTRLISLAPTQLFIVHIKLAFYAGVILGIPVIIYEFWQFIAPGLFKNERRMLIPVIVFTFVCFLSGGLFAYMIVVPNGLTFLASFQTAEIEASYSIEYYIRFVTMMIMVFGVVFEIPMVALFLGRIGLINHKIMAKYRKYSILGAVILGAVLTPPDGFTQLALAIPLWILYEVSILLVRITGKKNAERKAAEEAAEAAEEAAEKAEEEKAKKVKAAKDEESDED